MRVLCLVFLAVAGASAGAAVGPGGGSDERAASGASPMLVCLASPLSPAGTSPVGSAALRSHPTPSSWSCTSAAAAPRARPARSRPLRRAAVATHGRAGRAVSHLRASARVLCSRSLPQPWAAPSPTSASSSSARSSRTCLGRPQQIIESLREFEDIVARTGGPCSGRAELAGYGARRWLAGGCGCAARCGGGRGPSRASAVDLYMPDDGVLSAAPSCSLRAAPSTSSSSSSSARSSGTCLGRPQQIKDTLRGFEDIAARTGGPCGGRVGAGVFFGVGWRLLAAVCAWRGGGGAACG